jgi:excisionase family DNA binding protein
MSNEMLTTKEVSAQLGVSIRTVSRMAERGELPFIRKLAGKNGYLFDQAEVQRVAVQAEAAS